MAELVSLQTLLTYLTLISVPIGVFYHIMTLRNTRKNQQLILESRRARVGGFFRLLSPFGLLLTPGWADPPLRVVGAPLGDLPG